MFFRIRNNSWKRCLSRKFQHSFETLLRNEPWTLKPYITKWDIPMLSLQLAITRKVRCPIFNQHWYLIYGRDEVLTVWNINRHCSCCCGSSPKRNIKLHARATYAIESRLESTTAQNAHLLFWNHTMRRRARSKSVFSFTVIHLYGSVCAWESDGMVYLMSIIYWTVSLVTAGKDVAKCWIYYKRSWRRELPRSRYAESFHSFDVFLLWLTTCSILIDNKIWPLSHWLEDTAVAEYLPCTTSAALFDAAPLFRRKRPNSRARSLSDLAASQNCCCV